MKVRLELKNVGGLRGVYSFDFVLGKVNILEAPNAAGKSSVIRGLAAVLSAPFTSLPAEIRDEANRLGLAPESFINIYEDEAYVRLVIDDEIKEYQIRRDGKVLKASAGDSRFILAGLLTRESRLFRNLLTGDGNLYWIVNIMSLAEEFKKAIDVIESRLVEISLKLDELRKRLEDQKRLRDDLAELEEKRRELEREYEDIQRELSSIPIEDPVLRKLSKEIDNLREKEKRIRNRIEKLLKVLEEDKRTLREEQESYESAKKEYERLKKELEEAKRELASLKPEKIQELEGLIEGLRIDVERLREERRICEVQLNLFSSALQGIKEEFETVTCPLCGYGKVSVNVLKRRVEDLRRRISAINAKLAKALGDLDRYTLEKSEITQRKHELEEEINYLENEALKSVLIKMHTSEEVIKDYRKKVEEREKEIRAEEEKLRRVRDDLVKKAKEKERYERERYGKREELTTKLERIITERENVEHQLRELKDKLSRISTENVSGVSMDLVEAIQVYEEYEKVLKEALEYLREVADRERRGVARAFNRTVREILDELGFKEFDSIILNEDTYELLVYRQGGVYQPISSLSMAEKSAIATVLQVAMKMTYLPDVPFFIVDAIALDFDQSKVIKILDYLARVAEERKWLVVLTKLREKGPLRIYTYERREGDALSVMRS